MCRRRKNIVEKYTKMLGASKISSGFVDDTTDRVVALSETEKYLRRAEKKNRSADTQPERKAKKRCTRRNDDIEALAHSRTLRSCRVSAGAYSWLGASTGPFATEKFVSMRKFPCFLRFERASNDDLIVRTNTPTSTRNFLRWEKYLRIQELDKSRRLHSRDTPRESSLSKSYQWRKCVAVIVTAGRHRHGRRVLGHATAIS